MAMGLAIGTDNSKLPLSLGITEFIFFFSLNNDHTREIKLMDIREKNEMIHSIP